TPSAKTTNINSTPSLQGPAVSSTPFLPLKTHETLWHSCSRSPPKEPSRCRAIHNAVAAVLSSGHRHQCRVRGHQSRAAGADTEGGRSSGSGAGRHRRGGAGGGAGRRVHAGPDAAQEHGRGRVSQRASHV